MKKQYWFTQEILFETTLFGKEYMWLKDVDGKIYLAKVIPQGDSFTLEPLI